MTLYFLYSKQLQSFHESTYCNSTVKLSKQYINCCVGGSIAFWRRPCFCAQLFPVGIFRRRSLIQYTPCRKKTTQTFLSELRQIAINFSNSWYVNGRITEVICC